ncbi:ATP-binding protein [Micromonospora polyrhachis]|uniref:Serine/threonine-protein kinase RsbW n=1 Tax=Micromonospora polyrhachis TaxID=1282883 RepID=A0A7W7WQL4_9ACTN|nr:ATP-binding protein [Micromonospora polyrhachis]MBB4960140.1 serine/threonine-protein kinase RsbW [Micromonospora polyrhachis]
MTYLTAQQAIDDDVVLLTVPADGGYLSVLRTATAGLAARLQFALDEIEDLRIAVDEACAMLLAIARPDTELDCRFAVTDDALTVMVTLATTPGAQLPAESSFAWKVLTALTAAASATVDNGRATISLRTRRPSVR